MSNSDLEFPDDEPAASAPVPEATAETEAQAVARLESEVAKLKDHLLRTLADAENTRKRAVKDRDDATKYAIANFARDMLDFADNFHRALTSIPAEARGDERIASVITGIETMEKVLAQNFTKHGITKVEPLDKPFDANFHEVMFEVPGSGKPAGMVVQVIEAGYMLKDRLLRPARVGVAKSEGPTAGGRLDTKA